MKITNDKNKETYIFISYSHEDRDLVNNEVNFLKRIGYHVWFDDRIEAGSEWVAQIEDAISNAKQFIVFISPYAVESTYVKKEIALAINKKIPLLSIYLKKTELKGGLDLQLIDIQSVFKYQLSKDRYQEVLKSTLDKNIKKLDIIKVKRFFGVYHKQFYVFLSIIAVFLFLSIWVFVLKEKNYPIWHEPLSDKILIENHTNMQFVYVPGGEYLMGCGEWTTNCFENEKPVRKMTVNGFYIGRYEVTQSQWKKVMGNNPSAFNNRENHPVEMVSWYDVQAFIKELNEKNKNEKFRLPSESEWEYACRSGGQKEQYAGSKDLNKISWYNTTSNHSTHPFGSKEPNGLNIYDMSGNVQEWCEDIYFSDNHSRTKRANQEIRVVRGGSWTYPADNSRCTSRFGNKADTLSNDIGFRLARDI